MTDAEIKKALKYCYYNGKDCTNCPCTDTDCVQLEKYALDLINRKDAEIEEYKAINESLKKDRPFLIANAKAEAIKEFAERLNDEIASAIASNNNVIQDRFKKHKNKHDSAFDDDISTMCHGKILALSGIANYIDNLVKEMVGDAE